MGSLVLPTSGIAYLDANCFIYSIERIDPYQAILDALWRTVSVGQVKIVTSELTLLEVLVKPLKIGDAITATILQRTPDVQMMPITQPVLEEAANLRATLNLRTPDAIHAATALLNGCELFVTNDSGFHRISNLAVSVLSEMAP
jgi:predicted nucleic acid-binding protein